MTTRDRLTRPPAAWHEPFVDFRTHPGRYRHWTLSVNGRVATLALDVQEEAPLVPGYELKLNSYDLAVDIELYDAVQRLRFEYPQIAAVVIVSAKPQVFCAGANIRMLGSASHAHKVNFCKFTNETRNCIEDATEHSGQTYLCAVNGTASGGGYELALACDDIILIDDGASAVSLPELPLLAVLPGTGGLTRLVDKRGVRPDRADFFCTTSEGLRGLRALEWNLVDALAPRSHFDEAVRARALARAAQSNRPAEATGVTLTPLLRTMEADRIRYDTLTVDIDRALPAATLTIQGPAEAAAPTPETIHRAGASWWPLAVTRALDDAILHLRLNEGEIGTWVFRSDGEHASLEAVEKVLIDESDDWLVHEILLYWKRTLKRLQVSSRSLIALVEPGSCFAGMLLELVLAADRAYMLDGSFGVSELPAAVIRLSRLNFGPFPTVNGLTRLQSRFLSNPEHVAHLEPRIGEAIDAQEAEALGLVTFIPDDIDWEDEVRLALEERASFSPDALTGMEGNLRFGGPETMESKIFGRLSAWQNWIFQRPNAGGEHGALTLYGTGKKTPFDKRRV
jgi:benzoyl-CoA-dihydrodiol lyase